MITSTLIINALNPVHTTYGDIAIEHVDFYGSVHIHCVAVQRRMQHATQIELGSVYVAVCPRACVKVGCRT